MQVGFTTLREFAVQRPPLRMNAMKILLDLTTHSGAHPSFTSVFWKHHYSLLPGHSEKVTRNAAIITVKRWVPDVHPMNEIVRSFALRLLRRLQQKTPAITESMPTPAGDGHAADASTTLDVTFEQKVGNDDIEVDGITGDDMEDGEMPQEEIVQTDYLDEELQLPAVKSQILQHVELPFALCVKAPDILDEFVSKISFFMKDTSNNE